MNVTVVTGHLSRPPEHRVLPSGDELVAFEVTVPRVDARAESVPVVWLGAPVGAAHLAAGEEVLVVGRVRRRFYRSGGATQSRTEIVAEQVVPTRRAATARKALARAGEVLAVGTAELATARPRRAPQAQEADAS